MRDFMLAHILFQSGAAIVLILAAAAGVLSALHRPRTTSA